VRRLVARHAGAALAVSWHAAGARPHHYRVQITTSSGQHRTFWPTRTRLLVPRIGRNVRATITVTGISTIGTAGIASRAAVR
ncbi:MAG: hypothetical protein JWO02_4502, partial [Solirubrobacterales bacterium]|nr:hypothetical protein [Solirubrobacterales bacterium]